VRHAKFYISGNTAIHCTEKENFVDIHARLHSSCSGHFILEEVSALSTNRVPGHVLNDRGFITASTQVYEVQ
jgi:hypothetical protein